MALISDQTLSHPMKGVNPECINFLKNLSKICVFASDADGLLVVTLLTNKETSRTPVLSNSAKMTNNYISALFVPKVASMAISLVLCTREVKELFRYIPGA